MTNTWKLNTSNAGKLKEFQELFARYGKQLLCTQHDLKEVDADPLTVVRHKATQLEEGTLIDDSVLEIEGYSMGVNVKWMLDHLNHLVGRKAQWKVFLAYRQHDKIHIYLGQVLGEIVAPRGNGGFGFDPFFLPLGAKETLAQCKPDEVNARTLAVKALMNDEKFSCEDPLFDWNGLWQNA